MPTFNGISVTLFHLGTHTSGLERNLGDDYPLPAGTPENDPFAMMTEPHIYDYLSHYAVLQTEPGTTYDYSNFGFGLLGLVLEKVGNTPFKSLLKTVVMNELGMNRTSFKLTDEPLNNMAVGHDEQYNEVEPWSNDHDLVGCGGLNSSLRDMMVYLKANMGIVTTRLQDAMDLSQRVHFDTYQGLAWYKEGLSDGQVVTAHGGGSAGHLAWVGFNRDAGTGVVVLYNLGHNNIPVDVGKEILEAARRY
jgi:CubicO group peptidase (beta-lactamase class C family)